MAFAGTFQSSPTAERTPWLWGDVSTSWESDEKWGSEKTSEDALIAGWHFGHQGLVGTL